MTSIEAVKAEATVPITDEQAEMVLALRAKKDWGLTLLPSAEHFGLSQREYEDNMIVFLLHGSEAAMQADHIELLLHDATQ